MTRLFLVADDLTGALDSSVAFCGRFGRIPVYDNLPPTGPISQLAVNTGTRDVDVKSAVDAIENIAPHISKAEIPYKKIDSTLRGPWAAELACLMETGNFSVCIFAPAFPEQGRITSLGHQMISDADGVFSSLPTNPVDSLERIGLSAVSVRASDDAISRIDVRKRDVLVFDAVTEQDLSRITRWGNGLSKRILWCGSAGLAGTLAGRRPVKAFLAHGPILAIIGSNHPVSREQISHAADQVSIIHIRIGVDIEEPIATINKALLSKKSCLVVFNFPNRVNEKTAAASIRDKLHFILPAISRPNTLLVVGGETLRSVCMAVTASRLDVDAEYTRGVPHAVIRGGRWEGVEVMSKSGGFGSVFWLAEQLSKFWK